MKILNKYVHYGKMKETFKSNILHSAIKSISPTTNYVTIQIHREQYLSGFFKLKEKKNMTGYWIDKWGPFKRICVHFTSRFLGSSCMEYFVLKWPVTTILDNPWNHLIKQPSSKISSRSLHLYCILLNNTCLLYCVRNLLKLIYEY